MNLLDLNHILAIFTLPGCKTTNLFYCGLRTHRLFENLMLILRCKTTIYFIVGYIHADIFRILILFLFYVRYTWHDMTPTPYLPSKYNEVLLGLSYYNRKNKINFSNEHQMIKFAGVLWQIGGLPWVLVYHVKRGSETTEILKVKHPQPITNWWECMPLFSVHLTGTLNIYLECHQVVHKYISVHQ